MVAGQFDDTVELLSELKASGMPCYALSNMEPDAFAVRRARFAFMEWFDGHVISGLEGVAKPDRRIFEILLNRYGLRPQSTVFIDDQPRNVDAARDLGLVALRFSSAPQLHRDLQTLGLP
jgi:2-haloacid dehalogenase